MSIQNATWITYTENGGCESPVFRKKFSVSKKISSAVIDICGLGWFELYINGMPASDAVFEPAVSTYENLNGKKLHYPLSDKFLSPRVYFCRHDVTELLYSGENVSITVTVPTVLRLISHSKISNAPLIPELQPLHFKCKA